MDSNIAMRKNIIHVASSNNGKIEDFKKLFNLSDYRLVKAPKDLDVKEVGKTYYENALLKAQSYYEEFGVAALADDSGLEVDALPDELGVYTARFGPPGITEKQQCELLIEKLKDVEYDQRTARFVCVLCFYMNPNEIFYFEGQVKGHITTKIQGDRGFGFDPVFTAARGPSLKTFAECPEWKRQNSHRARAFQLATEFFKGRAIL